MQHVGKQHPLIATFLGVALMLAPLIASAATVADIETQLMHVLGQIAALEAQASGNSVACALVASRSSVAVGEPFALIWNSFGAKDPADGGAVSQWARGGISTVTLDKPGNYKYKFTFNGVSGGQTECSTTISIHM
mgnify:FL=1